MPGGSFLDTNVLLYALAEDMQDGYAIEGLTIRNPFS